MHEHTGIFLVYPQFWVMPSETSCLSEQPEMHFTQNLYKGCSDRYFIVVEEHKMLSDAL